MRQLFSLFFLLTKLFFIYLILLTFLIGFAMVIANNDNGVLNEETSGTTQVCVRDLCT